MWPSTFDVPVSAVAKTAKTCVLVVVEDSEGLSEDQLADLVTRDAMIGVGKVHVSHRSARS